MVNCVFWAPVGNVADIHEAEDRFYNKNFWISALAVIFLPIQGLFNFLIFIRPRFLAIRQKTSISRFSTLVEAVWYPVDAHSDREERKRSCTSENDRVLKKNDGSSVQTLVGTSSEQCPISRVPGDEPIPNDECSTKISGGSSSAQNSSDSSSSSRRISGDELQTVEESPNYEIPPVDETPS